MSRQEELGGGDEGAAEAGATPWSDFQQLDPEQSTMDEMRAHFERFKLHCEKQQQSWTNLKDRVDINAELVDVRSRLKNLRLGMEELHNQHQSWLLKSQVQQNMPGIELNAIEAAEEIPYNPNTTLYESDKTDESNSIKDKTVVITCHSTTCLFDNCKRRVDSQLMLLHYLTDHSNGQSGFHHCHEIYEGQREVLSFQPKACPFRKNQVLGLFAYGGSLEQQFARQQRCEIFNSFLPSQLAHLESHVPVVALMCRTASSAVLRDKQLARKLQATASESDQVFVIWLVTPNDRLQLNATLCLCGRDAAIKACSIVGVRQVKHSQNTSRFMPVDSNYWRVSYHEMQQISNDFKDELNLEVGLTQLRGQTNVLH